MKTAIFLVLGILALSIVSSGVYFYNNQGSQLALLNSNNKAWVEVVSSPVSVKNGDEIKAGDTLEVGQGGAAQVHFPDGSVLRLDGETKIVVNDFSFNNQDKSSIVKIKLLAGRVWSKVFKLATPASAWEVRTNNAVAVVRGTAFGMEYLNNKSTVLGSENIVEVAVIDPKTDKIISGTENKLGPNELATVEKNKLAIGSVPVELLKSDWVSGNKEADQKVDSTTLKVSVTPKVAIENPKSVVGAKTDYNKPEIKPVVKPAITKTIKSGIMTAQPKSLKISSDKPLQGLKEGDKIIFKAILTMADGSKKNVTAEIAWRVVGDIGSIDQTGNFEAQLSPQAAEYGQGFGAIMVTWKNTLTGESLETKTGVFSVETFIKDDGVTAG